MADLGSTQRGRESLPYRGCSSGFTAYGSEEFPACGIDEGCEAWLLGTIKGVLTSPTARSYAGGGGSDEVATPDSTSSGTGGFRFLNGFSMLLSAKYLSSSDSGSFVVG